jgi:hypothetical protein
MPSLDEILRDTLLFTGARGANIEPVEKTSPFVCPDPSPRMPSADADDEAIESRIRGNPIWHWLHNESTPGVFLNLTARSRGMGMQYRHPVKVCEAVVLDHVRVQREGELGFLDLPIQERFVIRRYFTRTGRVKDGGGGFWPIRLGLDPSAMVVLGFELGPDGIRPLSGEVETDELPFMPDPTTPRGFSFIAGERRKGFICVGPARYVVAFELVTCREDNTYVPPGAIGFARMFPLVWVMASENLQRVETQVTIQRPKHGMTHGDPTMDSEVIALVTADANQDHVPIVPDDKHIPYWQDFFEYYDTDPATTFAAREPEPFDHILQRTGEVTMVDARHRQKRVIEKCVFRLGFGLSPDRRVIGDSVKSPGQGQFDNVHLAPRMRLDFVQGGERVSLEDIAMAPFCIHDCLHMHARWSAMHRDKHLLGFDGFRPFAQAGAPAVPPNQTVFASFPDRRTLRYRAVADAVDAGEWQCFLHHGFAYVIDTWPARTVEVGPVQMTGEGALNLIKTAAAVNAFNFGEPFPDMPGTSDGWARVYWRLRFGGKGGDVAERLTFDLSECLR